MTSETTKVFANEQQSLKMKYSAHSFFHATWFAGVLNLKLYSVPVSSVAFWFIALPSPTWWNWFQYVCIHLVLTICAVSWGQLLGVAFSKKTAFAIHFYVTMFFIITSGAVINIPASQNPVLKHLNNFSPLRFSTEWMLR